MSQRYNDNTKRPKLEKNQLGILKIYAFCRKIQQRASGLGESVAGVTYPSMRIYPKSCCIFPLKVGTTLLKGSRNGAVGTQQSQLRSVSRLHANNSSPDIYRRKRLNWWAHLELCHRNPGLVERVLNWINCGEVHTYASYKTTRTWENFNNLGTKMILVSDEI